MGRDRARGNVVVVVVALKDFVYTGTRDARTSCTTNQVLCVLSTDYWFLSTRQYSLHESEERAFTATLVVVV